MREIQGGERDAGKADKSTSMEERYLTFYLQNEVYGIEITKIREIIGIQKITHVPKTPEFVEGVINLRGKVVPVVDLRKKFGLDSSEYTRETCIIVVEVHDNLMGVIVDTVIEVARISPDAFNEVPSFGGSVPVEYIQGICENNGKVVVLLDIENVLSKEEMQAAMH